VTSIAGHQTYPNGAGYTGAKHAAAVIVETLRVELLGKPVRLTEIVPGLVETEFSTVRFGGDEERAAGVYRGLRPLTGEDVADAITYAVTRPWYFTVARMDLFPRAQANAREFFREQS
jgi:NADP-dependent 3-hydroxy acid dehydrogenase YdfG